ncbi:LLM class flavin-dependent oxidoreductase [Frankia sp. AgB1.9]|uniref:LLM class flavin-dependent oxidoreductase n=1 Tax=unclassified Frankia TaxID=2632575 RepID=UPI001931AD16|nr:MULTISPECIES: LLM class flavin-dependent oxidoreductase [unclassified Frankia]MBL7492826.1 LLM class flavin-dependent oxidoreductase [Frankia sp. AgW1.1]MBL7549005.1 LLM class flavin-dependent oxidoreductase [Frankia sp. AgB1.9]MBL7622545.1 LLM class flavin-dependent oxidoreductase [Frankia sp. AgB1.8]
MRFSVNVPNFGDFADPHVVAQVAAAAESAGWDGLFVWDHVLWHKDRGHAFGDPWMLLTAAALTTSRIRLGTLVTPVARRRPEQLARQVATLDTASRGRAIFAAGLGAPLDDEFGSFGDTTDPVVLAERLDEGLDLLARYWTGAPVNHRGRHFQVDDVTLLPATVQQPRPPVWIAGRWPNRRPLERAARWDGVVPLFADATHGVPPAPNDVRGVVTRVAEHRPEAAGPFEVVVGGQTAPDTAADVIGPLADAGATWWDERQHIQSPDLYALASVLRRVEQGPPSL